jgi:hypothetical protein
VVGRAITIFSLLVAAMSSRCCFDYLLDVSHKDGVFSLVDLLAYHKSKNVPVATLIDSLRMKEPDRGSDLGLL